MDKTERRLDFFSNYLTIWVALCMIGGIIIGSSFPGFAQTLGSYEVANVSIPVAVVLLFMMYPIMLKINFSEIKKAGRRPQALGLTLFVNWALKPFTMALISWIFMRYVFAPFIPANLQEEYIAGMILLGLAPCTAMVLVWTYLAEANVSQALVQVAINDLIILIAFAPLGKFLLGVSTNFDVPFNTIFFSVLFYVAVPLAAAIVTRKYVLNTKGEGWLNEVFIKKMEPFTQLGLLLTLVLTFIFQGEKIINYPLHIILIAIPLTIQTYLIFAIGYFGAKLLKVNYSEAAPATMIGASNFFELSIAVALILYGMNSGAALATVVGVLVEVPIMLSLVRIMRNNRDEFRFAVGKAHR